MTAPTLALLLWLVSGQQGMTYAPGYNPDACLVQLHGRRWLVGAERCMRHLPIRRISGYLTIGLEESCFTETRRDVGRSCPVDLLIRDGDRPGRSDLPAVYRMTAVVRGNGMRGLWQRRHRSLRLSAGPLGSVPTRRLCQRRTNVPPGNWESRERQLT
ncbi:hypothetical protein [Sphingomonas sp.]|uniref:hypothetical protein n=1 Tax=Sphingomonas sp. TaxID=28214 RepID=UPI003CC517D2